MHNINYAPEIATANKFIIDHDYDIQFLGFLRERSERLDFETHSERWGLIYDWMEEHYPGATGTLITGLTYYIEE